MMRHTLFMFAACLSGAFVFVAVLFGIVAAAWALGGREWIEHFGENHWQTFVYMLGAAGITGLLMLPVSLFWHRRISR